MDAPLPQTASWEKMTGDELEKQYLPSQWIIRMKADEVVDAYVKFVIAKSLEAREELATDLGVAYGESKKECLDIFAKGVPLDAPIFMFIHGGYWQMIDLEISSFMVNSLTRAGAVVAVVGHDLAPDITMDGIVSQIKKAVAYVIHMAKRRGSKGVFLCGHSAGAYLAVMAMATDWMSEYMISPRMISGAVLVSGVYDLRPIVQTSVNDKVKMSDEDARRNSPALLLNDSVCKRIQHMNVLVAVGERDSPEFHRQSQEFAQSLKEHGIQTQMKVIPDVDHFDVIENLYYPDYSLVKDCLNMMKL